MWESCCVAADVENSVFSLGVLEFFMICRGLCACTEILWMRVLYVSSGSKVRSRTFGCVAMGSFVVHC